MSARRLKNQTDLAEALQSLSGLVAALQLVEDELDDHPRWGNAIRGVRSALKREVYDLINAVESEEVVVNHVGIAPTLIGLAA